MNECSDDIGQITDHLRLMLPTMFANTVLKYINQTVYPATCSSQLYTGHKLYKQRTKDA